MKIFVSSLTFLLAASLWAAESTEKEAVQKAITRLQSASSYAWSSDYTMGNGGGGKLTGQADKTGQMMMTMDWGGNGMEMAIKGTNGAVKRDGEWKSFTDLATDNPRLVSMLKDFKAPAAQLSELVKYAGDLKAQDGVYSADLSATGVKEMLSFGRRLGNVDVQNPKGSVKFWVKDGAITKYEYQNAATMSFDGNERDIDIRSTVDLKDVGNAKVVIPEEAVKKLGS